MEEVKREKARSQDKCPGPPGGAEGSSGEFFDGGVKQVLKFFQVKGGLR